MKAEKNLSVIKKTAKELLDLIGFKKFSLVLDEEEEIVNISVKTDELDFLIGRSFENLSALQLIIGLTVYKKTGRWQKILLNINDWRQKREEYLQQMAINLAQKVKFSGREIQLASLSASERRIIHLSLADHPDVITVSEGEGSHRHLIIKPKITP